MPQKMPVTIEDSVAATLFIPLYMRCLESRRPDALIRDPEACRLVERIDHDFEKHGRSRLGQVGTCIRSRQFDRAVARFVEAHDDPVVIQLGAGLDTRFQRVYAGKGVFYDLDLPEVIELRSRLLPACEENPCLAASMFDEAWMRGVREGHPNAAFILVAEGVLMFFEERQVRALFQALVRNLGGGEMHFDVCSPWMVRKSRGRGTMRRSGAPFRWGLDADRDLESWGLGLHCRGVARYLAQERLRWGLLGMALGLLPRIRNAFRLLHYEFGE